ncbi:hypothetical protein LTR10_023899 [Elasticomyces elasticus]|uniref:Uncharacterized protein n=1 Tax=Exophiala sideris TaxID=1016849 RepID=A0ABR0IYP4_9EURO|nr:hypothetical protein LTR10_023899 [Elasticomyces elasticus]KAK5022673.1 hypothetical protein LTS07_009896 [Exophiala sideris]KAK5027663.1 hypothetical protein LTR13_009370 [Exophiala sideris]KAK5052249.1 hypothetical protein LTR69_010011 [Exophiala sideris]KAK5177954.1 hypothetical protein LTR44_009503 [Eurotiomycetes sp. CCFEE 6388]
MNRCGNVNGNGGLPDVTDGGGVKYKLGLKHEDLDGLRAEYLVALEENRAAQRRYEDAVSTACQAQSQMGHNEVHSASVHGGGVAEGSAALLARHIELRRLQKQHASLVVWADDLEGAKSSAALATIDGGLPMKSVNVVKPPSETAKGTMALEDSLARSMQALEMAVVQAHQDAKKEKQRVQAMLATRRVLTTWLEEALEMCQGQISHTGSETMESKDRDTVTDAMIDEVYERYLDARRRVLGNVASLSDLVLGDMEQNSNGSQDLAVKSGPGRVMRGSDLETRGLLNVIEKALLPALQRQGSAQTHLSFATEQVDAEMARIINMLDRLGDESQLLQAFPILARSGRFQHAASALGKRADDEDETKDEISRRTEPWMFAANAADVALSSALEKALGEGKQAMESASKSLAELQLLKDAGNDHVSVL